MIWLLCATFAAIPEPATLPVESISALVQKLSDSDPRVRDAIARQIVEIGAPARPHVLAAWKSGDPRMAQRASKILLQLPWALPDDPPAIRAVFSDYGQRDEEGRRELAIKLAELPGSGQGMIRILREDPSETQSWIAYVLLVRNGHDASDALLRAIDVRQERVQVKTAAGRAWLTTDWNTGVWILRSVLDAGNSAPPRESEYLNFAFDLIVADAVEHGRYDEAAAWRRRQAMQSSALASIAELFALHAEFGPLSGFDDDLETFGDDLARPEVIYALARVQDRMEQPLAAIALRQAALCTVALRQSSAGVNPRADDPASTGTWLGERGWTNEARRELLTVLGTGSGAPKQIRKMIEASALVQLARIAADNDDNTSAIALFQKTLDSLDDRGRADDAPSLRAAVAMHQLREARRNGNAADAKAALDALISQAAADPDAAIDVVHDLRETGRRDEAAAHFERAYQIQKARIGNDRADAMQLNNLAWLCARCGERLPEAIELAKRATRLVPENGGYWDTLAEALFASGNFDEAVRLEQRALGLKPKDAFMTRQLARFREGAKK